MKTVNGAFRQCAHRIQYNVPKNDDTILERRLFPSNADKQTRSIDVVNIPPINVKMRCFGLTRKRTPKAALPKPQAITRVKKSDMAYSY